MSKKKVYNPFSHDHAHHDCDHDHDASIDLQDPAQQSLADALRVSFVVLLVLMLGVGVLYVLSGIFTVSEQQKAVLLQFGKIVGDPGEQIYGPGTYLSLPYPIQQVEIIDTSERSVRINESFWYQIAEGAAGQTADEMAGMAGPLNPEFDGSLITGDANIVHARFNVTYVVDDPVQFLINLGVAQLGEVLPDGRVIRTQDDRMIPTDMLVQAVAEQAVVYMVGQVEADALIRQQVREQQRQAERYIQDLLDEMGTGLRVTNLSLRESQMPLPVRGAYNAVTNAQSEKAEKIDSARTLRNRILGEIGGEAALPQADGNEGPLLALIREYELATDLNEHERMLELEDQITQAFESKRVELDDRVAMIGGRASRIIDEAQAYRTNVVQRYMSEARTFSELLEGFEQNPELMVSERWQATRAQILGGDVETFYIRPGSHLWIDTNLDPAIAREREEQRLRQEEERRRTEARQRGR